MSRDVPHPGGVYDHTVSSPGKGAIQNEIVPVKDAAVVRVLVKRARAFLEALEEL